MAVVDVAVLPHLGPLVDVVAVDVVDQGEADHERVFLDLDVVRGDGVDLVVRDVRHLAGLGVELDGRRERVHRAESGEAECDH